MRFSSLNVVRMTESKFECDIVRLIGQRVEFCFFIARQVYPDIGTGDIINTRLIWRPRHMSAALLPVSEIG